VLRGGKTEWNLSLAKGVQPRTRTTQRGLRIEGVVERMSWLFNS
jgi:hypothetical protein